MPIVPDTKDWTRVLERTCPECNFDVRGFPREEVGSMIRAAAEQRREVLARPGAGARPREEVWSPLGYGCHVRDVFDVYQKRLQLKLEADDSEFPNWDQDATAIEQRYAEQDPNRVVDELGSAAQALAASLDSIEDDQWQRTGRRDDGADFTVESLARYVIHDPIHHLRDAGYKDQRRQADLDRHRATLLGRAGVGPQRVRQWIGSFLNAACISFQPSLYPSTVKDQTATRSSTGTTDSD